MALNWRVGWVTLEWDGRGVHGTRDPVCDGCNRPLQNGIGLGEDQGRLWEHVSTSARTLRCGRAGCAVPEEPGIVSDLSRVAVDRLAELAQWALLAVSEGRNEAGAALLHRVELCSHAARLALQVDTGHGARARGDLFELLWVQPWSDESDAAAVAAYLGAYGLEAIRGRTLAGYLHQRNVQDLSTLAYWVTYALQVDAVGPVGPDAQSDLPFSDPELMRQMGIKGGDHE